jgi:hypothetical protein
MNNTSLIIVIFIAISVIALWTGIYLANRKLRSGQLVDRDMGKKYQKYQAEMQKPKNPDVIKIPVSTSEIRIEQNRQKQLIENAQKKRTNKSNKAK